MRVPESSICMKQCVHWLASGRAENRCHKSVNRVFSVWFLEQLYCLFSVPALLGDPQGPMHAGIYRGRKYLGLLNLSQWL